ncbi:arsC, partial [Symbiodinium necroappetens]
DYKKLCLEEVGLFEEGDEKLKAAENAVAPVTQGIEEKGEEWKESMSVFTEAQQFHDMIGTISTFVKDWSKSNSALCALKDRIKEFKDFTVKAKRGLEKKTKAGNKSKSAQTKAGLNATVQNRWESKEHPFVEKILTAARSNKLPTEKGLQWNIMQLLDAEPWKNVDPVKLNMDEMMKMIKNMDYYEFQKQWVQERAKGKGPDAEPFQSLFVQAVVTKTSVSNMQYFKKSVGSDAFHPCVQQVPDTFAPHFTAQACNSASLNLGTDFGLADARLCVEGSCTLMGISYHHLFGKPASQDDLPDARKKLESMTWDEWHDACVAKGWCCILQEGKTVIIPGDHVFISVNIAAEEVHCCKIHLVSLGKTLVSEDAKTPAGGHMRRTHRWLQMLCSEQPILQQMRSGKILAIFHEALEAEAPEVAVAQDELNANIAEALDEF